jgi:hypothetical protein
VNSPKKRGRKKMLRGRKISTLFSSLKDKYENKENEHFKTLPIKVYAIQFSRSVNIFYGYGSADPY